VKKKKNILTLIPARSGSKGIKNKNIIKIKGKPLIYWSIQQAKQARLKNIVISTDSKKIATIVKKYGNYIKFIRPKKFSLDNTRMHEVIKHSLIFFRKKKIIFDLVLLLQPTSPLRLVRDIKNSLKLLEKNKTADSVISAVKLEDFHPARMKLKKNIYLVDSFFSEKTEGLPRQKLKDYYLRNGAIYLFKVKSFYKYKSIKGKKCILYEMPKSRSLNLDDSFDLKLIRLLKK
jgi:CMP-N,N'-diacetyllegionaminic acid synthase